jgi:predicted RNase H-like HicB family nuclease
MRNEFTSVIEEDGEWFIGYCPEIPGANGQGRTVEECRANLAEAIALILEDRREDGARRAAGCHSGNGCRAMKRSSLLRHLRKHGCSLKREGREHSLWIKPKNGSGRSGTTAYGSIKSACQEDLAVTFSVPES